MRVSGRFLAALLLIGIVSLCTITPAATSPQDDIVGFFKAVGAKPSKEVLDAIGSLAKSKGSNIDNAKVTEQMMTLLKLFKEQSPMDPIKIIFESLKSKRMFRGDLDGAADVQQFIDEYLNGWMGFLKVGVQVYQMYMGGAIGSTLGHHKIRVLTLYKSMEELFTVPAQDRPLLLETKLPYVQSTVDILLTDFIAEMPAGGARTFVVALKNILRDKEAYRDLLEANLREATSFAQLIGYDAIPKKRLPAPSRDNSKVDRKVNKKGGKNSPVFDTELLTTGLTALANLLKESGKKDEL